MGILENYSIAFPARDTFYHGLSGEFYDAFKEFKGVFDAASHFMNENLYEVAYENPKIKPELHTVCLITHCIALYKLLLCTLRNRMLPLDSVRVNLQQFQQRDRFLSPMY